MIEEIKMITEQLGVAHWFWGMALGFLITKLLYWDKIQDEFFEDSKDRDDDNRKSGYWTMAFFCFCWILALLLTLTQKG